MLACKYFLPGAAVDVVYLAHDESRQIKHRIYRDTSNHLSQYIVTSILLRILFPLPGCLSLFVPCLFSMLKHPDFVCYRILPPFLLAAVLFHKQPIY